MICPGETESRAWVQDDMSGNKSFMRLDFARRTTMDLPSRHVLLVFDSAVAGRQHIPAPFG
jgi:hypothetical protein